MPKPKPQPPAWDSSSEKAGRLFGMTAAAWDVVKHRFPQTACRRAGTSWIYNLEALAQLAHREGCANGIRTGTTGAVDPNRNTW